MKKENKLVWKTEVRKISDLVANVNNARTISERMKNELKKSFEKFDYVLGDECLHPDTNIDMDYGTKPIKDVEIGDLVKTYNEKTKKIEVKPVLKVHKNISKQEKLFEITLSDGKKIKITGNHKVLLKNGNWTRVDNLKVGYEVEKNITITGIKELYTPTDVYNLHIQDNHNYFAENMCVSNCHLCKADSLKSILEKNTNTKYRIGLTGTLDGSKTNKLVIEGLFGKVKKVTTTNDLIKQGHVSPFRIKCLVLKHPPDVCKIIKSRTYQEELEYLILNTRRNRFIKNLTLSLEKNTLVLYQMVEKHGEILYNLIKDSTDRNVYFIHGGIITEDREEIRNKVETENGSIIVASFGTYSTGINIKNLHNIIFASPSKSRIRNLQSIGRGLRLNSNKTIATLYDISDDMRIGKYENYTFKHLQERIEIYNDEKFNFKIYRVDI